MKTRTKLLSVLSVVLIIVALGVVFFAAKKEMRTYRNQRLVELTYEYWGIESMEFKRIGEEATRVFLPEIICEVPGLFQGRRFYFCLRDFRKTGRYIDLLVKSEEGRVFNPFTVGYDVLKPPSDIIRYEWCDFNWDYFGARTYDDYKDSEREEEKKIKKKSEEIIKIAEETFNRSLACYQERKKQEEELKKESLELGAKLLQLNEALHRQIKTIESSIRTFKGYYSFAMPSERFGRITCTFFYDPDPDFKLARIEIDESPGQRCFDVGYDIDYNYSKNGGVWGFINNESATLGSFELLSDVLELIGEKIKKDPEIVRIAVLGNSVK